MRYPFTILVILMMIVCIYALIYRVKEQRACSEEGGTYVQTFGGYDCVGGK